MKLARTLLVAGSAMALAVGSAFAAGKQAKTDDPGFNTLDRDSDGQLSRSEAARNSYLVKRFKEADKDADGKLSRTEYLEAMTQKDLATLKNKATGEDRAKSDDPGFNNLDRDDDGKLSRSEAARNPYLVKRFKEADHDNDGQLSRLEYLRVMTKKDASTLKQKVSGDDKADAKAGAGGSKAK